MHTGTEQVSAFPTMIPETADIVVALLSTSDVSRAELPQLITDIHRGLLGTVVKVSEIGVDEVLRTTGPAARPAVTYTDKAAAEQAPSVRASTPEDVAGPSPAPEEHPMAASVTDVAPAVTKVKRKARGKSAGTATAEVAKPVGVEAVNETVTFDHIVCMEDGKRVKDLGTHLSRKGISPDAYRKKWGLPTSYPMLAPSQILKKGATFEFSFNDSSFHSTRKP